MLFRSLLPLALATALPAYATELPRSEGDPLFVTATRAPTDSSRLAADTTTLSGEALLASGALTLGDALANQPGIEIVRSGGSGQTASIFIRGTESKHSLLLLDGMRFGSASTGLTSFDLIPLEVIDRVEIIKGPASALYGSDAIGGVIQVFTRRGQGAMTPYAGVEVGSWGQRGAYAGLGGVWGDTRYHLAMNQKQADGFNAMSNPKAIGYYNEDRDAYRSQGVTADVAHFLTEQQEIGLRGMLQESVTDIDAGALAGANVRQGNEVIQAYWKSQWRDNWQTEFRAGESKDRSVTDVYAARYVTRQDQLAAQSQLKTNWGEWLFAYDYLRERLDSSSTFSVSSRQNSSLLLGWQFDWRSHHWEAQFRHDWNSQFGEFNTGRLGYAWVPEKGWKLFANAGRAYHAPTFNDAYNVFLDDNPAWQYYYRYDPNPNLKPELSRTVEVGFNWESGPNKAALSIYRTQVQDLIALQTTVDYSHPGYPYGYTVQNMTNINSALIKGLDLKLGTKLGLLSLDAWGNWQTAQSQDLGTRLPRRPGISGGLRAGVEALPGLQTYVELTGQGLRYDDLANSTPLHGYGLVNLGADYKINKQWRLSAHVGNLLERRYELAKDYSVPGLNGLLRLSWSGI